MKTFKTNQFLSSGLTALSFAMAVSFSGAVAADVTGKNKTIAPLKPDVPYVFVVHNGRSVRVERDAYKQLMARPDIRSTLYQETTVCPPFCLSPMQAADGVETWGEAEIVDFMLFEMRDDTGVLLDTRTKKRSDASTIPGSVNFHTRMMLDGQHKDEFNKLLESFGARRHEGIDAITRLKGTLGLSDSELMTDEWDFTDAKTVVVWSTSAAGETSIKAVNELRKAGYPASKLKWYRGGMAAWQYWGFNTISKPRF